jgi:hypothetical protein
MKNKIIKQHKKQNIGKTRLKKAKWHNLVLFRDLKEKVGPVSSPLLPYSDDATFRI